MPTDDQPNTLRSHSSPPGHETAGRRPNLGRPAWWVAALGLVFLVALSVRVATVLQIRSLPFFDQPVGDARGYYEWARTIASAATFDDWVGHASFYQAPLYPYVLATWFQLAGDDVLQLRLFQVLLAATGCVLLAMATARLFDRRAGLAGGLMLALYAPGIFYDTLIQKTSLASFLLCALLYFLARAAATRCRQPRASASSGEPPVSSRAAPPAAPPPPAAHAAVLVASFLLGLLIITRENALVWAPCLLGWAVWQGWRCNRHRAAVSMGLCVTIGVGMVLAPVGLRNRSVAGEWSLSTFQAGPNFFIGNSAEADGRYRPLVRGHETPQFERQDAVDLAEADLGRALTAREVSDYWMRRSWSDIRSQPLRWLGVMSCKLLMVLHRYEVPDVESLAVYENRSMVLWLTGRVWHFGVLLPLACLGIVFTWPRRRELWLYFLLILSMVAAVSGFFILGRYRMPLVPLLMPFAAVGVVRLAAALIGMRGGQHGRPGGDAGRWLLRWGGATAMLAALVAHWPGLHPTAKLDALSFMNLGVAYAQRGGDGDLGAAVHCFARAVEGHPQSAEARYNLALGLDQIGNLDAAVGHYRAALQLEPTLMHVDYNLAVALERLGQTQAAVRHYQAALRRDPADADAAAALERIQNQPG